MTPWLSKLPFHSLTRRASAADPESVGNMVTATTEHVRAAIVHRSPASTTSSASNPSCTPGSTSRYCQFDTSNTANTTLPIALGVALPLLVAFVLCFYLHRRYKKRQRMEDDNEKHRSLDFGLGDVPMEKQDRPAKRSMFKKSLGLPDSNVDSTTKITRNRGISLDGPNPFVLPPVLHDTRGSLHSLSRSQDDEGPYHSVHLMRSPDVSCPPSAYNSRPSSRKDSSSVNTTSSNSSITKANLLSHAQKPATAIIEVNSPPSSPLPRPSPGSSPIPKPEAAHFVNRKAVLQTIVETPAPVALQPSTIAEETDQSGVFVPPPRNVSRPVPPKIIIAPPQAEEPTPVMTSPISERVPPPVRSPVMPSQQSPSHAQHTWRSNNRSPRSPSSPGMYEDDATYVDVLGIVQKESTLVLPTIPEPAGPTGLGLQNVQYDNPNERANRVHSVYHEYFDNGYGYDYGYGYDHPESAAMIDPETGHYIVAGQPWASPVTRRAMTPPPRAPPQFRGSPSMGGRRSSSANRQGANTHRGRAYSSTSPQPAFGGRGRELRRPMPLPSPLSNLPTPGLLQTESEVMSAIDFAPPMTYNDRKQGKSPSPRLGQQPFAPRVRAFSPLASSFDDLHVLPSPNGLRKSTSFTSLDFAPQPRFKRADGGSSDTGSVHSGRSNLSAAQLASIRAGAYRVSRIPKEFVGTRDDFSASLKPSWDMRS